MPPQIQVGNDPKCDVIVVLVFKAGSSCAFTDGSATSTVCVDPGINGSSVFATVPTGYPVLVKAYGYAQASCPANTTVRMTWDCATGGANTYSCSPTTYGIWGTQSTGLRVMHF